MPASFDNSYFPSGTFGDFEEQLPSTDCQPTVGQQLTDSWPTGYQQLTDSWPTHIWLPFINSSYL